MDELKPETPVTVSDATIEMMNKLKPIVQEIIELIASSNLPVGNLTAEEQDAYQPVSEQVIAILLKHDIKYFEETVVFQLLGQITQTVQGIVRGSLNRSYNVYRDIKFGKALDEVLMSDIDSTIKQSATNKDVPIA